MPGPLSSGEPLPGGDASLTAHPNNWHAVSEDAIQVRRPKLQTRGESRVGGSTARSGFAQPPKGVSNIRKRLRK